ncbi:MAG: hypothetical protein EA356_08790 [Geminicoccaceae bacterium]|nr:MAG: hypothetical protein EA356_08790 [Geminicoccaceae bacterium]
MISALDKATLLMTLTRQLTQVLDAETDMLRRVSLQGLTEIQAEKQALSDVYEAELRDLRRSPEMIGALDQSVRVELEAATRTFREAVQRNVMALGAAKVVVERVLTCIAQSAVANPGYRPGAALGQGAHGAHVVPFALDRQC